MTQVLNQIPHLPQHPLVDFNILDPTFPEADMFEKIGSRCWTLLRWSEGSEVTMDSQGRISVHDYETNVALAFVEAFLAWTVLIPITLTGYVIYLSESYNERIEWVSSTIIRQNTPPSSPREHVAVSEPSEPIIPRLELPKPPPRKKVGKKKPVVPKKPKKDPIPSSPIISITEPLNAIWEVEDEEEVKNNRKMTDVPLDDIWEVKESDEILSDIELDDEIDEDPLLELVEKARENLNLDLFDSICRELITMKENNDRDRKKYIEAFFNGEHQYLKPKELVMGYFFYVVADLYPPSVLFRCFKRTSYYDYLDAAIKLRVPGLEKHEAGDIMSVFLELQCHLKPPAKERPIFDIEPGDNDQCNKKLRKEFLLNKLKEAKKNNNSN